MGRKRRRRFLPIAMVEMKMKHDLIMMDGAVGTSLWAKAGSQLPVWRHNVENPALVREHHREMVAAGARMILTNTFGVNAGTVNKTPYMVSVLVASGVRLCREAVGGQAQVMLAVGPLWGLMAPQGDITEEAARAQFMEVLEAGVSEKPDGIFLMTFMDLEMLKNAAGCARRFDLPLFCAMSFEKTGKTHMGNTAEDMVAGLAPYQPDAIGLNCSEGPDLAMPVLRRLKACTDLPLIFKPNAGMTSVVEGKTMAEIDPDAFVRAMLPAVAAGASYIGGCCGTSPAYIKKLAMAIQGLS